YRLGLHNQQHVPPGAEPTPCQDPESPISTQQSRSWLPALEDNQLLAQTQVLRHQQRLRLEERRDCPPHPSYHRSLPLIVAEAGVFHPIRSERSSPDGVFAPYTTRRSSSVLRDTTDDPQPSHSNSACVILCEHDTIGSGSVSVIRRSHTVLLGLL